MRAILLPGARTLLCHASPARDARLPSDSGSKQNPPGSWFLAVASVHPRCSRRLGRFFVTPRLLATRGFPPTPARNRTPRFLVSRRRVGPSALLATARTLLCHASHPPRRAISRPTAGKPIRDAVPPWALPIRSRLMPLLPGARRFYLSRLAPSATGHKSPLAENAALLSGHRLFFGLRRSLCPCSRALGASHCHASPAPDARLPTSSQTPHPSFPLSAKTHALCCSSFPQQRHPPLPGSPLLGWCPGLTALPSPSFRSIRAARDGSALLFSFALHTNGQLFPRGGEGVRGERDEKTDGGRCPAQTGQL